MSGALEFWPKLVLAVLATWRLTHLLAREDGPWGGIARLRESLGNSLAGRAMDCFHCLSLWVAAPIALWLGTGFIEWLLAWLALSGAACLCERIGHADVIMQPVSEETGGEADGMLRTETQPVPQRRPAVGDPGDDPAGHLRH